jgi:hypothetical protein
MAQLIRIVRPEPEPDDAPVTYVRVVRPEPDPHDGPETTPHVPTAGSRERRRSDLAKLAARLGKPIPADFLPGNPDA